MAPAEAELVVRITFLHNNGCEEIVLGIGEIANKLNIERHNSAENKLNDDDGKAFLSGLMSGVLLKSLANIALR